jgi:hypothetical protein
MNNSQIDSKKIVFLEVVNSFGLDFIIDNKNQEK